MESYWDYLAHHGIKGQSWGVQNGPPYPLDGSISTGKSLRKLQRQDNRWLKKQSRTTAKKLERKVRNNKTVKKYDRQVLQKEYTVLNKDRSLNKNYIAAYNQLIAKVMNDEVAKYDLKSPSGMVLAFIAKRGELGVHVAMRTENYDMTQVKRGVDQHGKIAYKDQHVDQVEVEKRRH